MSLFSMSNLGSLQVVLSAFDSDASLDVLDHPVLNLIYYLVCIIFVISCSLRLLLCLSDHILLCGSW